MGFSVRTRPLRSPSPSSRGSGTELTAGRSDRCSLGSRREGGDATSGSRLDSGGGPRSGRPQDVRAGHLEDALPVARPEMEAPPMRSEGAIGRSPPARGSRARDRHARRHDRHPGRRPRRWRGAIGSKPGPWPRAVAATARRLPLRPRPREFVSALLATEPFAAPVLDPVAILPIRLGARGHGSTAPGSVQLADTLDGRRRGDGAAGPLAAPSIRRERSIRPPETSRGELAPETVLLVLVPLSALDLVFAAGGLATWATEVCVTGFRA